MSALIVAVAAGLILGFLGAASAIRSRRLIDLPDERRLHKAPTPRGGGIGIPIAGVAGLFAGLVLATDEAWLELRLGAVVVFLWAVPVAILGFLDDHHPLRSRVKFAVLVAMATTAVLLGLRLDVLDVPPFAPIALPPVVAIPLSVLWLIWLANVFNFMDGMDALAAGSGVIFFGVLTFWSLQAEQPSLATVAAATGAAHLGFLWFNRPPARVFMGDAGSLFTGALLGALALALARPGLGGRIGVGASTLLMGTFVWDATYTIVRRLVRGDPMLPHRTHLYQRLAVAGWSHGRVRGLYLGLAVAYAAGAVLLTVASRPIQGAVVAGGVALALALTWLTRRAERR